MSNQNDFAIVWFTDDDDNDDEDGNEDIEQWQFASLLRLIIFRGVGCRLRDSKCEIVVSLMESNRKNVREKKALQALQK